MFRRCALGLAALLAASGLAVALPGATPAAHAAGVEGRLVYIKSGNVWVARSDGSGQLQVTTGGGWSAPSMSADGRIAALRGERLVVIDDGRQTASFELPTLFVEGSCSTIYETPPLDAAISPDGTKVVWSQLRSSNCNGRITIDALSAITDATRYRMRGLVLGHDASWIGNGKVVLDDNGGMRLMDVDHAGAKGHDWFDSYDLWNTYYDFNSISVSPDGTRVAYLLDRQSAGNELIIDHPTTGNPLHTNSPGVPSDQNCQAQSDLPRPDDGPVLDNLSFSPSGDAVAFIEGGNAWTATGIVTAGGCEQRVHTQVLSNVEELSWSAYGGAVAPVDTVAPSVRITRATVQGRTAKVSFSGTDDAGARGLRFQCRVDRGAKRACGSPLTVRNLKPGRHTVTVWATDAAGNTSRPATRAVTVRR